MTGNENFKIVLDDPSTQSLQLVVADYSVGGAVECSGTHSA
jgi:hypothetical protein